MFEEALYKVIKERGIAISKLAKSVNMKYFSLYDSLHGERELRSSELYALCKTLNLKIDDLELLTVKAQLDQSQEEVVDA